MLSNDVSALGSSSSLGWAPGSVLQETQNVKLLQTQGLLYRNARELVAKNGFYLDPTPSHPRPCNPPHSPSLKTSGPPKHFMPDLRPLSNASPKHCTSTINPKPRLKALQPAPPRYLYSGPYGRYQMVLAGSEGRGVLEFNGVPSSKAPDKGLFRSHGL